MDSIACQVLIPDDGISGVAKPVRTPGKRSLCVSHHGVLQGQNWTAGILGHLLHRLMPPLDALWMSLWAAHSEVLRGQHKLSEWVELSAFGWIMVKLCMT
jgi:hypothetical protein